MLFQSKGYPKAKNLAEKVLRDNFIKEAPVNADALARIYNLKIYYCNFEPDYSNLSGFLRKNRNMIFVNCDDPVKRKNFIVAHELGHYLLGHTDEEEKGYAALYRGPIIVQAETDAEREATVFAANLIIPDRLLVYWIRERPLASNNILAGIYGAPPDVVGFRRQELNL
jgi:Zn-dependent peptidase ImmA (M78 family)